LSESVRAGPSGVLRWFAAEFFVVVTGVLVALGATSWWEGRQSYEREVAYLTQLLADLDQTRVTVARSDQDMRYGDDSAAALVRSFAEAEPPPQDSLDRWIPAAFAWADSPRMVVATAQALTATGDLTLIRGDSLRVGIVAYLEVAREHEARNESDFEYYRRAIHLMLEGLHSEAFPTAVEEVLGNRSVYAGAQSLVVMRNNEAQRRREMAEQAEELRTLVEAYLAVRR
jgi:hypothetical protein